MVIPAITIGESLIEPTQISFDIKKNNWKGEGKVNQNWHSTSFCKRTKKSIVCVNKLMLRDRSLPCRLLKQLKSLKTAKLTWGRLSWSLSSWRRNKKLKKADIRNVVKVLTVSNNCENERRKYSLYKRLSVDDRLGAVDRV